MKKSETEMKFKTLQIDKQIMDSYFGRKSAIEVESTTTIIEPKQIENTK